MKSFKNSGLDEEFVKLVDDLDNLEELSGASTWNNFIISGTVVSLTFGNDGWICTWTHECKDTCR